MNHPLGYTPGYDSNLFCSRGVSVLVASCCWAARWAARSRRYHPTTTHSVSSHGAASSVKACSDVNKAAAEKAVGTCGRAYSTNAVHASTTGMAAPVASTRAAALARDVEEAVDWAGCTLLALESPEEAAAAAAVVAVRRPSARNRTVMENATNKYDSRTHADAEPADIKLGRRSASTRLRAKRKDSAQLQRRKTDHTVARGDRRAADVGRNMSNRADTSTTHATAAIAAMITAAVGRS